MVWVRLAQLRRDLVGRPLPDLVEPVDEDEHLGARVIRRVERRIGVALLEVADDLHRADHDAAVVVDDRNESLAADALDLVAIAVVDDDRLDRDLLVASARATRSTFVEYGAR